MEISVYPWVDLNSNLLYKILQLRQEVFVREQYCPYNDCDNKDFDCLHLTIFEEDQLVAYARCIPPGLAYPEASIGRVCTHKSVRNRGYGKTIFGKALHICQLNWPDASIKILAQYYLVDFYTQFGFGTCSERVWEDDILHFEMIKSTYSYRTMM